MNDAHTPEALSKTDIQSEDHSKVSPKSIYQKSSSTHQCDCNCKLLAVELEGVKLEMVLMQNDIESKTFIANTTRENEKNKQLEQDLVNEREKCSQLEEDISILIRGRDTELIELNQTIPLPPLKTRLRQVKH